MKCPDELCLGESESAKESRGETAQLVRISRIAAKMISPRLSCGSIG